ncbi:ammonium transporter [Nocardia arthritidis]|uniref:Ammonium transporter n=1 Tax=Nocardia arthritidis TaxID=228602 RepID=A0A6G9Y605_9NOCA|nr:ammonium transporter [Nocardia arthritidis]QIS08675.1 ammonium transporter [Nocardia arthritidis]
MILRKITAVAVPLVAAVAVGAGVSHAEPATTPEIGYQAQLVGDTVVTTLTNGHFQMSGNNVDIKDEAGNTVVTLPLSFRQDGLEFPLPHAVRDDGRVLELTAVKDYTQARPATAAPIASNAENQRAMNAFSSQFGIATAIGGFIGTAIGALVGLTGIVAGPGVIASVIAGAAVGGIIGTVIVGGPTLLIAGIDLIGTLAAPPGTTKWSEPSDRK